MSDEQKAKDKKAAEQKRKDDAAHEFSKALESTAASNEAATIAMIATII